jgi:hypothetical protein
MGHDLIAGIAADRDGYVEVVGSCNADMDVGCVVLPPGTLPERQPTSEAT